MCFFKKGCDEWSNDVPKEHAARLGSRPATRNACVLRASHHWVSRRNAMAFSVEHYRASEFTSGGDYQVVHAHLGDIHNKGSAIATSKQQSRQRVSNH
jgi:hypothetical protein